MSGLRWADLVDDEDDDVDNIPTSWIDDVDHNNADGGSADSIPEQEAEATNHRTWAQVVAASALAEQGAFFSVKTEPFGNPVITERLGQWQGAGRLAHLPEARTSLPPGISPPSGQLLQPLSPSSVHKNLGKAGHKDRWEAGDPVGIRSVQSILMQATQTNLSHFHTAGMVGTAVGATPTAAEAMDSLYTRYNTSMKFMMLPIEGQFDPQRPSSKNGPTLPGAMGADPRYIRRMVVGAKLGSFVTTVGSSFTVLPEHENVWYDVLGVPVGNVLRMYVNYRKMLSFGLTLRDLAQGAFGDDCPWRVSPDFMGMIDVEVSETYMSSWLSRMECNVCGTPSVLSCEVIGGTAVTRGTNVLVASRIPGVDVRTITSNNVVEVERIFGIEAAASVLNEIVESRVVSDFMTRTGTVLSFHKNNREIQGKGLLTSMGFERPKDDIKDAIIHRPLPRKGFGGRGKNRGKDQYGDNIQYKPTVYECIMTGRDPPTCFDVLLPFPSAPADRLFLEH